MFVCEFCGKTGKQWGRTRYCSVEHLVLALKPFEVPLPGDKTGRFPAPAMGWVHSRRYVYPASDGYVQLLPVRDGKRRVEFYQNRPTSPELLARLPGRVRGGLARI